MSLKKSQKDLFTVDHSTIRYEPFRKDFYVEAAEISRMTEEEVSEYRLFLDSIKIKGSKCPRPIKKWSQAGLSQRV